MTSKYTYKVIGVMSGTSLDGIDLAYVEFKKDAKWHFDILKCTTLPYTEKWKHILSKIHHQSIEYIREIEKEYSKLLAKHINDFIKTHALKPELICSHGHTIWHQPQKGITLQIGDGATIKRLTHIPTVHDFRRKDVELGGQGAPLVPIGDHLLFKEYNYCLNLGGFSNISFSKENKRLAFDICPVNMALNYFTNQIGLAFDKGGHMARQGQINSAMLDQLNKLSYYKKSAPKSLGKEWFEASFLNVLKNYNDSIENHLRTLCEHIAIQISHNLKEGYCLVSGGGVHNTFLMHCIQSHTKCQIVIPKAQLIDYKEALIFGLLGVLKLRNEVNCLASVTGASRNSVGGVYVP